MIHDSFIATVNDRRIWVMITTEKPLTTMDLLHIVGLGYSKEFTYKNKRFVAEVQE